MATTIKLKSSVVKDKQPLPSGLEIGEVALNANSDSPALYFKDNADNIIELKPGSSVGSGGTPPSSDNEVGDLWWDGTDLLVWNGTDWQPVGGVQSVNGETGVVVLDAADVGALAPGDNVSELVNDADYLTLLTVPVESVNGKTGVVVLGLDDIEGITLSPLSNGDIIAWNGSAWVNTSAPPADISGSSISDLNDVDTTGVADGDMLYWVAASGEWQSAEAPAGTDLTGYLQTGDNISELVNDSGYLTEADLEDIDGALFFKGSIDATAAYPPSVTTGDVWSNTVTGTAVAQWVGITNVVAGDLLAKGETQWTIIGSSTVPDLSDYIKKGDDVTELTNNAVYLLTTETAADSEKLDGEDGDYYLNYQNATNTPDLEALDYVPLGSWAAIPELV